MKATAVVLQRSFALIFSILFANGVLAQTPQQEQGLATIVKTSNEICAGLNLTSSKTEIKLSADAKAKVAGMLGKLVDIGIGGSIDVSRATRVAGLLDEHVFSAAKTLSECRLEVLKLLKDEFLKPGPPASTLVSILCEFPKPNEDYIFAADWDDADRSYVKLDGTFRVPGTHPGRSWETFKVAEHNSDVVSWCKYLDGKEARCAWVNRRSGRVEIRFPNEPTIVGACRKSSTPAPGMF